MVTKIGDSTFIIHTTDLNKDVAKKLEGVSSVNDMP